MILGPLSKFLHTIDVLEQEYTPSISFNERDSSLFISGTSMPDDTKLFYTPVLDWMDHFLEQDQTDLKLNLIFKLDYFNTSSSKMIYELLAKVEKKKNKFKSLKIIWYYDVVNEAMLESGKHFEELVSLPFEYKSYI